MASFADVEESNEGAGLHHLETTGDSMASSLVDEGAGIGHHGEAAATPPDAETTGASELAPPPSLDTPPGGSNTGNVYDPYATSYDSDDDDDMLSKKGRSKTRSSKHKPLPPIHFVPATTTNSGDADHRPSSFSAAPYCYISYEPPAPPEPGSLASNQIVAKMMAKMNYRERTGLGKYGHGIIDPIVPTFKCKKGGLGTVELGPYQRLFMPPEPNTELERGAGAEAEPAALDFVAVHSTTTKLQREGAEYAAARARERLHDRKRAAHMRGLSLSTYSGEDKKTSGKTEVIRALAVVERESALGKLTFGGLIHEFSALKKKFPEEYRTRRLSYKAIRLAARLLPPLVKPRYGISDSMNKDAFVLIQALGDLVGEDASASTKSAYDRLVNEIVLATVKASSWNVMEPQPMLQFVNTWKGTLEPSTMAFILQKIVRTKLVASAEVWSPEWWSTVTPNVWVGQWIPHLGHGSLQSVYKAIARQLERSLSGKRGVTHRDYCHIMPWREVFDPASWNELIEHYVVPLLRKSLRHVSISAKMVWGYSNPFPLVMKWASLVPVQYMVPLLEEEFFGNWKDATNRFLLGVKPLPEEASEWYESWKGLFTPELLAEERITLQLEVVLDMINLDEGSSQDGGLQHGETAGQESETPDLGTPPDSPSNTETTTGVQGTAAAASQYVTTIHFVRTSSGDTDHHRPSLFSPPSYCYSYYPPLPPQPGSLETNQIVARLMAQMKYEEGTGLGKYGHGIIDPIQPTIKYGRGGIGKFESPYDSDWDDDMGPPADQPELELGPGEAEPEAVDAEEVRAMDTLQREREAYAAARARERRHQRVRAYNIRGQRPPKHDDADDGWEGITSGYTAIKRALKVVREQSESGKLTLGGLIHEFARVQAKFPEEYRTNRMPYKAISFAAPLLHSQLLRQYNAGEYGGTEPLLNRTLVVVEALKDTLGADASAAYPRLINDLVMVPPLDAWWWRAEEPEPMLRFVNRWKGLLPQATMDSILDEVVLPELVAAADEVRLTRWSSKPNVCVGMWIPHLGHARLRIVYIIISRLLRDRLCGRGGISNYDYELALKWKEVFDPASWDEHIERHVVPRLRKALHDLKISVRMTWVQSNNFFPLVMRWASIVPVKYMVPLLIQGFFKKWMYANYRYLMGERPRLDEAMAWYEVWKGLFTPELLAEKRVVVQLEAGLDMINRWEAFDIERMLATLREEGAAYAAKRAQKMLRASGSARTAQRRGLSSHDREDRGPVSADKEIVRAMAVIQRETLARTLTLGGLICEFEGLKEKFPEAYGAYRLAQTAVHLAAPRLRPLLRPQYGR
uniref:G-patch domain-containing protein n=1 Tax=Oryza punctata TaxID=4537 RepID=A0A0E0KSS3_ORYPU